MTATSEEPVDLVLDAVLQTLGSLRGVRFESFDRDRLASLLDGCLAELGLTSMESLSRRVVNDEALRSSVHDRLLPRDPGFALPPDFARAVIEPALERHRGSEDTGGPTRFWVLGCGEGALPIQLAMVCSQHRLPGEHVRILATDIDRLRVRRASDPSFAPELVPEHLIESAFSKDRDDLLRPLRELRSMIHLEILDPLTAPPFRNADAILCPTLHEHLSSAERVRMLHRLAAALPPHGVLWCPGLKVGEAPFAPLEGSSDCFVVTARESHPNGVKHPDSSRPSRRQVYEALLAPDVDLALLIDAELHVLAALRAPEGRLTGANVRDWMELQMAAKLRLACSRMESGGRELIRSICRDDQGDTLPLMYDLRAITRDSGTPERFLLLRRHTRASDRPDGSTQPVAKQPTTEDPPSTVPDASEEIARLRQANHDLQFSNAELLTEAEGLRASKQDLESIATELRVMNRRQTDRIQELRGYRAFAAHVTDHASTPALHLDLDGRLQFFTTPAAQLLHLVEQDLGRKIAEITCRFHEIDFATLAQRAFDEQAPVQETATNPDGGVVIVRAERLSAKDGTPVGVVMMIEGDDVDAEIGTAASEVTDGARDPSQSSAE